MNHSSNGQRTLDFTLGLGIILVTIYLQSTSSTRTESSSNNNDCNKSNDHHYTPKNQFVEGSRSVLLLVYAFIFGCEFMHKCFMRDAIFVVNNCHTLSILQILALALMPVRSARPAVRNLTEILVPMSWGPIGGLLYPATYARTVFFSHTSYYLQHSLLVLTPLFLLLSTHPEILTKRNYSTSSVIGKSVIFGVGWFNLTHAISLVTLANANLTLCPFDGFPLMMPHYRIYLNLSIPLLNTLIWYAYFHMAKLVGNLFSFKKYN